jgi:hypothetical protein
MSTPRPATRTACSETVNEPLAKINPIDHPNAKFTNASLVLGTVAANSKLHDDQRP